MASARLLASLPARLPAQSETRHVSHISRRSLLIITRPPRSGFAWAGVPDPARTEGEGFGRGNQ